MSDNPTKLTSFDFAVQHLIDLALQEDIATGDLTTRHLIGPELRGQGYFLAKQDLVLCGMNIAVKVFQQVDARTRLIIEQPEGTLISAGTVFARVHGYYGSLLTAERTVLNFLSHLSGISTLTARFVEQIKGTTARIYDTRKTLPGFRLLEKYAVATGGGSNHRFGLYDAVLIKNNHLATGRSISDLIGEARAKAGQATFIEVEVESLEQVREAVVAQPDIVMLDNMDLALIRQARALIPAGIEVEVSGNVNLETVRQVALCGVDRISVGALTHSAPAADISLRLSPDNAEL